MKSNSVIKTTRHPWASSIAGKMIITFCALSAIVLIIVQLVELYGIPFATKGDIRSITQQELMTLSTLADTRKQLTESWIWERRGDAVTISESPAIQTLIHSQIDAAQKQRYLAWFNSYINSYQYEQISIIDIRNHTSILSTKGSPAPSAYWPPYLSDASVPGMDESISYVVDTKEAKNRLHIIHQITKSDSADEQPTALIDLSLDPQIAFKRRFETGIANSLGKTGVFVLADSQGNIILNSSLISISTAHDSPLQLAMSGGDGMVTTTDSRGEQVLAVYRHIRITPDISWALVIQKDQKEILAEAGRRLRLTLLISLAGIFATISLSLFVARLLTKPLSVVAETAARIESGDLSARVHVTGSDEIAALAGTFNTMANRIQEWHNDFDAKVMSQTEIIRQLNFELEQKVIERTIQLETSNQELESFCYSVSHDLRAPLRNINMYSGVLKEDYRKSMDERGIEYLEKLGEATVRMGKIIDDLLTLSRVARIELNFQTVNLSDLFRSEADTLMETAANRIVEFSIEEGITVLGDPTLLEMVVQNLMENAWKYTRREERAVIVFGTKRGNNELIYYLNDNGTGFDMSYAENLFKPFQRLHSPGEFEGSGVGLATVQRIIQRHGGRIWAEATPDIGATFYFTLAPAEKKS